MIENKIGEIFTHRYGKVPDLLVKAPGRINVIGEHTDYNDGYVLPAAIGHYIYFTIAKNDSSKYNIYSYDYDKQYSVDRNDLNPDDISWLSLVKGIIYQLKDRISGFDLAFAGDIPVGAGLSSSAALCCGTAFALNELFSLELKKWDIAKMAQKSEHDFVNVKCGIMDQFASMFGLTNHVLLLDCTSLEYEESEINISGSRFFLLNSNVQHELNDSDYNARRVESEQALKELKSRDATIRNYKDVKLDFLQAIKSDEIWWKRAYHIVSENFRVLTVNALLKENKVEMVGQLMSEGHDSLKSNFEVTCEETDFLMDELRKEDIVHGARQVGGGFGGCVLGIAKDKDIPEMIHRINTKYKEAFGKEVTDIQIRISKGCHLIN